MFFSSWWRVFTLPSVFLTICTSVSAVVIVVVLVPVVLKLFRMNVLHVGCVQDALDVLAVDHPVMPLAQDHLVGGDMELYAIF